MDASVSTPARRSWHLRANASTGERRVLTLRVGNAETFTELGGLAPSARLDQLAHRFAVFDEVLRTSGGVDQRR